MRKLTNLIVAVFFTSIFVFTAKQAIGQGTLPDNNLKPRFGFRIAPNVGWMKPDAASYENEGASMGFSWGFIAEFPMADNYGFTTGFNILFNGGKLSYPHTVPWSSSSEPGRLDRKYGFKYLELPAMFRLQTSDRGGPVLYGQIGLGTGILLDARGTDTFISSNSRTDFDKEKISDEIRLFRMALLVGLGVEYPLGPSLKAIGGLAFNNGFSNTLKGSNTVNSNLQHKAFSNLIELNIGIKF